MTSSTLKAVLFDLDGTLIDTAPDFCDVLARLCEENGRTAVSHERVRETVSHGARALVTLAFDLREGEAGFEPLRQRLLDLYAEQYALKSVAFPGIESLIRWCDERNLHWGVVTNKPAQFAEPMLAAIRFSSRPATIVCPDHVKHTKPDPEPMHLACRQLGIDARSAVYVGDHRRDIEAGNNAGMTTVAVAYGYLDPADPIAEWGADHVVEHADAIAPLLQQYI